jgi:phosphoribosylaminoimidazole-succinocarboxamide synthase
MNALPIGSDVEGLTLLRRGKARDVYDLGERLLIVSTDRLSAFDHVLPTPIPGKGRILTAVSAFWFERTRGIVPNHMISVDPAEIQAQLPSGVRLGSEHAGRVMLCRKARRLDVECVARGYLAGSAWKEYRGSGQVCGRALPAGLSESAKLPEPIFTPATKADEGHDENISRRRLDDLVGPEVASRLESLTLKLYAFGARHLEARGAVLADTKFEFGFCDGELILIDEAMTPDSSRVWKAPLSAPPASFDKQYVRDYLESARWDKNPPAPALPAAVVEGTLRRYEEFMRIVRS